MTCNLLGGIYRYLYVFKIDIYLIFCMWFGSAFGICHLVKCSNTLFSVKIIYKDVFSYYLLTRDSHNEIVCQVKFN